MSQARTVKDVMTPDIMTVADEMTADELVHYLTEHEKLPRRLPRRA